MDPLPIDFATGAKSARQKPAAHFRNLSLLTGALLLLVVAVSTGMAQAQDTLPFQVSNPKNKQWSSSDAARIYLSACDLLARTIRPENPPPLHPRFLLVLGAEHDEYLRDGAVHQVRLKSWDPEKFAEAVVLVAVRDVLRTEDLMKVAHQSVSSAAATVSAGELAKR